MNSMAEHRNMNVKVMLKCIQIVKVNSEQVTIMKISQDCIALSESDDTEEKREANSGLKRVAGRLEGSRNS